jgi:multiple sugar transport system ATP-binding protein
MAFVELRGVSKRYGAVAALDGVSIAAERGELLVLVGPSGCGKSTLLNCIAGLEDATSGEIVVDGRIVNALAPSERDIAMVFQSYALYPNMSVKQNITFGLEMRGVPKAEREAAVAAVAQTLRITHLLDRKPAQLSGGQRQRVAMGRALVRNPKVFLFDEPLSNLDAKLRIEMRTEIKRLHQRLNATMVYVTHDQVEAMTLASKIAVLKDGIVHQFGTPAEIYHEPANLFVAGFMGSPPMNLVPARLEAGANSTALLLDRDTGGLLRLDLGASRPELALYAGGNVVFGIRPEAVTDLDSADGKARVLAKADCLIEVVEPAGSDTFAVTRLGRKEVIARLRGDAPVSAGQTVPIVFNLDKALFFDPKTEARISR